MKNADAREQTIYLEVAGRSMDVHVAVPPGPRPHPAVLLMFHRYPKAGHGFQNPARSKGRNADEIATADAAWATMLALMRGSVATPERAKAQAG
jgi:hypothetical protein